MGITYNGIDNGIQIDKKNNDRGSEDKATGVFTKAAKQVQGVSPKNDQRTGDEQVGRNNVNTLKSPDI